jgi:starvation-inducible DNA-binding protein
MKYILFISALAMALNGEEHMMTQKPCNENNMMHKTSISGLDSETRKKLIDVLNQSLADLTDLAANLKQAHWNIKGWGFISLHEMFDKLAKDINAQIDTIAERIISLGGTALGTIRQAAQNSRLEAYPLNIFSSEKILAKLAENHSQLGKFSRENIKITENLGDMVTSDLYIELTNLLDKNLWLCEARLELD